jgi:hypothetical protein
MVTAGICALSPHCDTAPDCAACNPHMRPLRPAVLRLSSAPYAYAGQGSIRRKCLLNNSF